MMKYIMKHEKPQILHRIAAEVAGQFVEAAQADAIQSAEPHPAAEQDTQTQTKTAKAVTDAALEAKRSYNRQYREKNAERLREYKRNWNRTHPDKVRAATERYWQRRAIKELEARGTPGNDDELRKIVERKRAALSVNSGD